MEEGAICCGGRRLSKFPYVSEGPRVTLDPIPIPYIHYQETGSSCPYSNTVFRLYLWGFSHGDVKLLRKIHLEITSDGICQGLVKKAFH